MLLLFFVEILTMECHYKIVKYLKDLDKKELWKLGEALGLSYSKVKKMDPLCEDMVEAWLNKEDRVLDESGEPTWECLKTALKEIGQTGLASSITKGTAVY